jgi:hypothetical protein
MSSSQKTPAQGGGKTPEVTPDKKQVSRKKDSEVTSETIAEKITGLEEEIAYYSKVV